MSRPTISIIIPVYNVAQYLPSCLDSVLEQTIDNLEVLCINDASLDNSDVILNRYAKRDTRIAIFNHGENFGQGVARNTGIAAARGEYVFFLDSDDILFSPYSLSRLYSVAKQDVADEVIGGTLRWNEETGEREFNYHRAYLNNKFRGVRLEAAQSLAGNVIGCNKLIRTSLLKQHDLQFPTNLQKFEDTPFSWKVHLQARSISVCTDATYLHRLRHSSSPQSIMQRKKQDYLSHAKAADNMLEFFEQNLKFNSIRQIIDKYFIMWFQQDVSEVRDEQISKEEKDEMLEVYQQILSRIPKTSTQHLSTIQISLLQLMQKKQYEIVWKTIRSTQIAQKQMREVQQIKQLQNQLNIVYNSTSWRMTAPFRFTVEKIKKYF